MVEESIRPLTAVPAAPPAVQYSEIDTQSTFRITTENSEFDRVMGGGVVPGSLVLLGGEPGIGKSTLLLQIAESLSRQDMQVLYVAGEESGQQIKLRGDRLGIEGNRLYLAAETCLERIFEEVSRLRPVVVIVDSIQTIYTGQLDSVPGSIGQVRECAVQLLSLAKRESVAVFLIGHITKEGALAGPKALEHVVDAVLYFEGDRHQNQKIVRAVKNRFGPANELGIFQMSSRGLICVENPSKLFLAERAREVSGSVVLCAMKGSRPVLVEVQALVSQSSFSTARRMSNGVDPNRVSLLLAMLEKRLGLHLLGSDVYVNVAGGLSLVEPAVDLAVVAAVVSSLHDFSLPGKTVIFGEVGLAGEVRAVSFAHSRVKESLALGFQTVILPKSNLPLPEPLRKIQSVGVSSVSNFLEVLNGLNIQQ
jgi:DNA repair protein RadA/Sms